METLIEKTDDLIDRWKYIKPTFIEKFYFRLGDLYLDLKMVEQLLNHPELLALVELMENSHVQKMLHPPTNSYFQAIFKNLREFRELTKDFLLPVTPDLENFIVNYPRTPDHWDKYWKWDELRIYTFNIIPTLVKTVKRYTTKWKEQEKSRNFILNRNWDVILSWHNEATPYVTVTKLWQNLQSLYENDEQYFLNALNLMKNYDIIETKQQVLLNDRIIDFVLTFWGDSYLTYDSIADLILYITDHDEPSAIIDKMTKNGIIVDDFDEILNMDVSIDVDEVDKAKAKADAKTKVDRKKILIACEISDLTGIEIHDVCEKHKKNKRINRTITQLVNEKMLQKIRIGKSIRHRTVKKYWKVTGIPNPITKISSIRRCQYNPPVLPDFTV